MRNVVLMLLLTGCLNTRSYSQLRHFDFSANHETLKQTLTRLGDSCKCTITCVGNPANFHDLCFKLVDATVETVLKRCLHGLPFSYKATQDLREFTIIRRLSDKFTGRVLSEEKEALENLFVQVLHSSIHTLTDKDGYFTLYKLADTAELIISGVSIQTKHVHPEGRTLMDIRVVQKTGFLIAHTVTYQDGYHSLRADIAPPGSWYQLRSPALDRVPSADPLAPLNGQASGVSMGTGSNNPLHITIRGISTLYAGQQPLVIVDKFPFDGDIRGINLNDMESITILKDAPASSLWGARSGNGVLVFTPKTGSPGAARLVFNANTTVTEKPNLFYMPIVTPAQDTSLEKLFYARHFYDGVLSDPGHPAISPVVETLDRLQRGIITQPQADALINGYAQHSILKDLSRLFYRPSVRQQYFLSLSGGTMAKQYYLSAGYDRDPTNLRQNDFQRYTVHGSGSQAFLSGKLRISTLVNYADIRTKDNNTGALPVNYTYAALAGPKNKPLPVDYNYAAGYIDTAGGGRLADWSYRPLQELYLADNTTRIIDYYGQLGVRWNILPGFSAEGIGRLMRGQQVVGNRYSKNGFYARDLSNLFAQQGTPDLSTLIPAGDILDRSRTEITAHYLRGQLSYMHQASSQKNYRYDINAGAERSEQIVHNETQRLYGYNPDRGTNILVDPVNPYPTYITGAFQQIPMNLGYQDLYTRYLSFFVNTDFAWKDRYNIYAAVKKDGTNFVGVNTNRKWAPFWALGLGYDASKRSTDTSVLHSTLKLKLGYGCNGNVGNRTGYLVTQSLLDNNYGAPQRGIVNPPDRSLSWETTYMLNGGLEYGLLRDRRSPQGRIQGSLEFFHRWGVGLLGSDTLAPSTGLTAFFGNSAAMKGWGADLVLHTENIRQSFRWTTDLLLSYVTDRITKYAYTPSSASGYVMGNTPRTGRPLSALYSYRNAGLDPANGDPQGYLGKQVSKAYNAIVNAKGDTGIIYSGSYQPSLFGGLTNTFAWKRWTFSALVNIKACFVFRRPSINYYAMITGQEPGNRDYGNSWKTPGDEKRTNIPSPPLINDPYRSSFYAYSTSTITRGDCIRLQDLRLSYDLSNAAARKISARQITFYGVVSQVGIIWRSNKFGIDPEAFNYGDLPKPRSYTLGVHIEF